MLEKNEIDEINEHHTNNRVHFQINFTKPLGPSDDENMKKMRLRTTMQTTNMVLFDKDRKLKRYQNTKQIIEEFYGLRYTKYEERKEYLMSKVKFFNYRYKGKWIF